MPNALQIHIEHTCTAEGGQISVTDVILDTASVGILDITGGNGFTHNAVFPGQPLPYTLPVENGNYTATFKDEYGRTGSVRINELFASSFIVDCLPAEENPTSDLALTLETTNPTTVGGTEGSVTLMITGTHGPFKTRIGTLELTEGKVLYDGLSAGSYLAYVEDTTGAKVQLPFTLVGPPPVYHTEPAAKYLAVGGVLPNEINYHFNFNMFDEMGVLKESHYVQLDIYREDETAPFATTRARLKDALATVDVSRYVRNIVKIVPPPVNGLVSPDYSAMKRFHVKYQEYANGAAVGQEVTTEEKYAVNAALQDLVNNNYDNFVIFE